MADLPEPSDELKAALSHMDYLRGGFLSSYAQAEFLLADMYIKAVQRGWYAPEIKQFPEKLRDRVAVCKKILGKSGPLTPYASDLLPSIDHLTRFTSLRQFLVHGHTTLLHNRVGRVGLQLQLYQWTSKEEGFKLYRRTLPLNDLETERERLRLYVSTISLQFRKAYIGTGLETDLL